MLFLSFSFAIYKRIISNAVKRVSFDYDVVYLHVIGTSTLLVPQDVVVKVS